MFAGRYKSLLVDGSDDMYLRVACDYVHLNPARAGLLGAEGRLEDYAWSSFTEYLKPPKERVEWLRVDRLLGEMGIRGDDAEGRREFGGAMAARCGVEGHADEELWKGIRRGWKLGAEDFVERNWGSGFIFVHFSDLNLVNYSETFFSLSDKAMRGIGLLALSAFFMPRCSAIHTWDAVVFFHSNLLRIAPFAAQ